MAAKDLRALFQQAEYAEGVAEAIVKQQEPAVMSDPTCEGSKIECVCQPAAMEPESDDAGSLGTAWTQWFGRLSQLIQATSKT